MAQRFSGPSLQIALALALAFAGMGARPAGWLERVQSRLDGIHAFRARFIQEYEPRAFSRHQKEGGVLTFLRPGRMRWEYEWPRPKLALCDGRRAWVYYPDDRRAEVEPQGNIGDEAPAAQLLLGRWKLKDRFRLEGVSRAEGEVTLHLVPEKKIEGLKALRLTVGEQDLTPRQVEMEQEEGDVLRYRFEEWNEAVDPPAALFRFEPPAGVRLEGGP
jgi:outer membrane lipoprotein carrier protein